MNKRSEHLAPRLKIDQRKLYGLVRRQGFTKRLSIFGVLNGLVHTILRGA